LEESEVMEFQLSRLEKEMESMKEEFKKELYALKYDINSIKKEILNGIRVLHTLKSSTQEQVNENKDVESQSPTGVES
jgi:predicted RNase H-like nuclease (RuvC/YqgF family)